jgi:hypothetical protein
MSIDFERIEILLRFYRTEIRYMDKIYLRVADAKDFRSRTSFCPHWNHYVNRVMKLGNILASSIPRRNNHYCKLLVYTYNDIAQECITVNDKMRKLVNEKFALSKYNWMIIELDFIK